MSEVERGDNDIIDSENDFQTSINGDEIVIIEDIPKPDTDSNEIGSLFGQWANSNVTRFFLIVPFLTSKKL